MFSDEKEQQCIISINDYTFEDWLDTQTGNMTNEQQKELLQLYDKWKALNACYKELEYDYLSNKHEDHNTTSTKRKLDGVITTVQHNNKRIMK